MSVTKNEITKGSQVRKRSEGREVNEIGRKEEENWKRKQERSFNGTPFVLSAAGMVSPFSKCVSLSGVNLAALVFSASSRVFR
jgi:hypothetical protein